VANKEKTMQALVYEGAGVVCLRQVPEPEVPAGHALVHVRAVGVCGSDLSLFRGGMPGLPVPVVPGHEFSGYLDNGDCVVVNPMLGCGECPACHTGNTHICARRRVLGLTHAGAYAERVAVPLRNLVPAGKLDAARAALAEPVANGVHAWRRAGSPRGKVAIIGAGAIGMCLLHVLRQEGLTDITVTDVAEDRLRAASAGGASATAMRLTGQFEAVFDAVGTRETRADAVACTALGGTVALIGLHDDVLSLSAGALVTGDRTVAGCFGYSESAFARAVELAATLEAPWVRTVAPRDAEQVLAALISGTGGPAPVKTLIRFAD
jgi:threonine dehydrogenase-like Zn-dependent dehydrogenase